MRESSDRQRVSINGITNKHMAFIHWHFTTVATHRGRQFLLGCALLHWFACWLLDDLLDCFSGDRHFRLFLIDNLCSYSPCCKRWWRKRRGRACQEAKDNDGRRSLHGALVESVHQRGFGASCVCVCVVS